MGFEDGWRLGGIVNGDRKTYGYPALRINRPTIVEALLKYTNDYPGLINLRWSSSINKIAESNAGVEVTLQDGNIANGDIVIEAVESIQKYANMCWVIGHPRQYIPVNMALTVVWNVMKSTGNTSNFLHWFIPIVELCSCSHLHQMLARSHGLSSTLYPKNLGKVGWNT